MEKFVGVGRNLLGSPGGMTEAPIHLVLEKLPNKTRTACEYTSVPTFCSEYRGRIGLNESDHDRANHRNSERNVGFAMRLQTLCDRYN